MSANVSNKGGGENITPEVTAQTSLVTEILESLVGKVTLANATPETILEGYSAYVGQQLVTGEMKPIEKILGFTKCYISTVTFANAVSANSLIFTHGLGVPPEMFLIIADKMIYDNVYSENSLTVFFGQNINNNGENRGYAVSVAAYTNDADIKLYNNSNTYTTDNKENLKSYIPKVGQGASSFRVAAGIPYTVIALA